MTTKTGKTDAHTGNDSPDSLEAVKADFLESPTRHCNEFVRAFHEAEYQEAIRLTDDIADYRGGHANLLPSEVEIQKRRVDEAEARLGTIINELKSNAAGAEREVRGREQQGAGKEPSKEDEEDKSELEACIRVLREMIDEIMRRWEQARSAAPLQTAAPSPAIGLLSTDSARSSQMVPFKRAALIAAHLHQWPTIERDLADARENGLAAAAKAGARGWKEPVALEWARANGKLKSDARPADSVDQAMHNLAKLPSRRHQLGS